MYDATPPEEFFEFDRLMEFYKRDDEDLKEDLIYLDDELDLFYYGFMERISERGCLVKEVFDIILIARHLERIGDLLLKIGQRLIFTEKGKRVWIK